jgi:hypothetical protein
MLAAIVECTGEGPVGARLAEDLREYKGTADLVFRAEAQVEQSLPLGRD